MLTIAAAVIFFFGFAVLWNGEVPVSADKKARGAAAKIVGGLLMAAGPLGYLAGFVAGQMPQVFSESQRDYAVPGLLLGLSLLAIVIGIVFASPTKDSSAY